MASKLRLALLGALGLLAAACGPHAQLARPDQPMVPAAVETAREYTQLLDPPGCTGVEVSFNVIVTAKHCVDDDAKAGDPFPSGGILAYVSPDKDFVVLVTSHRYGYGFIDMRQAEVGEHLYLVGYPQQVRTGKQAFTVTDGIFTGALDPDDGSERVSTDAYFGNSGGGVWGDDGALVGILVNGDFAQAGQWPMPYPGAAYMVPVAEVVKGLNASL